MNEELKVIQPRTCGECSLCCRLLHVKELNKSAGVWCDQINSGRVGCAVYTTRPQSCKDFECLWLQEDSMPDELRPDKSHVVLWVNETGEIMLVSVDPDYPDAYKTGEIKVLLDNILTNTYNPKIGVIVGKQKFPLLPVNYVHYEVPTVEVSCTK